jgi:hypothetical protein
MSKQEEHQEHEFSEGDIFGEDEERGQSSDDESSMFPEHDDMVHGEAARFGGSDIGEQRALPWCTNPPASEQR